MWFLQITPRIPGWYLHVASQEGGRSDCFRDEVWVATLCLPQNALRFSILMEMFGKVLARMRCPVLISKFLECEMRPFSLIQTWLGFHGRPGPVWNFISCPFRSLPLIFNLEKSLSLESHKKQLPTISPFQNDVLEMVSMLIGSKIARFLNYFKWIPLKGLDNWVTLKEMQRFFYCQYSNAHWSKAFRVVCVLTLPFDECR